MKIQNAKLKMQYFRLIFKIIKLSFHVAFNLVILTFAFCILNLSSVHAQNLSLSLSPPILEVIIKPGKSITQVYKITNDGDPVIVTPKISEFTENGIRDNPDFSPDKWISVINTDISFDKPFLLKAKETRQLILKISPPLGLTQKDYYRIIHFVTTPNPALETSQSSVSQDIGSPLIITVTSTGLLARGAQITRFQVPQILDSFDPLIVEIDVKNSGNSFFHPIGTVSLIGSVGKADFNIVPNIIISSQTRQIAIEKGVEASGNQPTLKLPGFFLGKYSVEIDFTLDQGSVRIKQIKQIYALPWKAGIFLIITVIIVFKLLKLLRSPKSLKKR